MDEGNLTQPCPQTLGADSGHGLVWPSPLPLPEGPGFPPASADGIFRRHNLRDKRARNNLFSVEYLRRCLWSVGDLQQRDDLLVAPFGYFLQRFTFHSLLDALCQDLFCLRGQRGPVGHILP